MQHCVRISKQTILFTKIFKNTYFKLIITLKLLILELLYIFGILMECTIKRKENKRLKNIPKGATLYEIWIHKKLSTCFCVFYENNPLKGY